MSHITEVETQIKDLVCLQEALTVLNLDWQPAQAGAQVKVRGWNGVDMEADVVIRTGTPYDIGVRRKADGSYELIADWWGIETASGATQAEWVQKIVQRYAYLKVVREVKAQGYAVAGETTAENQNITLTVRRWQ